MMNVRNIGYVGKLIALATLLASAATFLPRACAQADGQKTFSSSKQAVDALIQAVRDGNTFELIAILGPGSEEIVSSGDAVADKNGREDFLARYDLRHFIAVPATNRLSLNIGKDGWQFPIPLVHSKSRFYWDGAAGKEEILYRRIGRNELSAIDVCKGVVAAQHEYAAVGHDGLPAGIYAQQLMSEPGKQNGLYWQVNEGEKPSPAGPLLAGASAAGYGDSPKGSPYHGYYYRVLRAQGANAKGGVKSYIVDGKMTGGFALVAHPADYRSSGVMTFLVNDNGTIYQKDLGENTDELVKQMNEYNPDRSWKRVN